LDFLPFTLFLQASFWVKKLQTRYALAKLSSFCIMKFTSLSNFNSLRFSDSRNLYNAFSAPTLPNLSFYFIRSSWNFKIPSYNVSIKPRSKLASYMKDFNYRSARYRNRNTSWFISFISPSYLVCLNYSRSYSFISLSLNTGYIPLSWRRASSRSNIFTRGANFLCN